MCIKKIKRLGRSLFFDHDMSYNFNLWHVSVMKKHSTCVMNDDTIIVQYLSQGFGKKSADRPCFLTFGILTYFTCYMHCSVQLLEQQLLTPVDISATNDDRTML